LYEDDEQESFNQSDSTRVMKKESLNKRGCKKSLSIIVIKQESFKKRHSTGFTQQECFKRSPSNKNHPPSVMKQECFYLELCESLLHVEVAACQLLFGDLNLALEGLCFCLFVVGYGSHWPGHLREGRHGRQDSETCCDSQSGVRIKDCTLRVPNKLLHYFFMSNNKSNLHAEGANHQ